MKTERLKKAFTDAASDVADQFYPKEHTHHAKDGRTLTTPSHPHRGEFIRDSGLLWVKLADNIEKYVEARKKKPIAVHTIMLVEEILEHFDELEGIHSDEAYYELVEFTESMLLGQMKKGDYLSYVEMVFGVEDGKQLIKMKEKASAHYKSYIAKAYNV